MQVLQGLLEWGLPGIPMHLDLQQGLCAATAAAAAITGTAAAKNLSQPPLRRLLKRQLSQRSDCKLHSIL